VSAIGLGARAEALRRLGGERFDVVVVGGGITGAGIALDLAARGQRVALVERDDFAAGTSSRSSKLIHGGLRYLAQLQFGVTREALQERHALLRLAPALVEPLPFVIPVVDGLLESARVALGLTLYDLLAGRERSRPWARLRPEDLRALAPGLDTARVTVAYTYHDCRTDDARLTLAVLRQAHRRGAVLANRVEAVAVRPGNGAARGLTLRDRASGGQLALEAERVVLATGAWGEGALALEPGAAAVPLRPSKGVHLYFSQARLPVRVALYVPTGVDDRLVFVVPWQGRVLVGTTDTDYDGPLDRPTVGAADVAYLIGVLNRAFPSLGLSAADVVGAQAGIRPLVAAEGATSHASREERVWRRSDGVVAIAGGKLTTYRRMAEKVAAELGHDTSSPRGRPTESIPIAPAFDDPALRAGLSASGLAADGQAVERLLRVYGAETAELAAIVAADRRLAAPIVAGQPPILAEVVFGARHEQARGVADVLARRTRLLLLDGRGARAAAPAVADLLAGELGWSADEREAALRDFEQEAAQYALPASALGQPAAPAAR
jgi:glycerol-3-phosphate dehydrogenase